MSRTRSRRRRWPWIAALCAVVVLVPVAVITLPILTHQDQGLSNQGDPAASWPTSVEATGDDGRQRTLSVVGERDDAVETSALVPGQRLIVRGAGFDASQGIYVAICVIPDDPATKPGPCVGGVPDQEQGAIDEGAVQYAASNWINDDWAWKLFGARSFDDTAAGTFTAYLEVGDAAGDGFDCAVDPCGIYTRNDHTALRDRVQDLYIPIAYAGS